MLSGTTCKLNQECAQALWQANSISYKFGLHCEETRGLCTDECRCWGLDSHVHACIMSRWIFSQIRAVIPLAWTYSANVTGVVQCAAHGIPAERCDWTHVKSTLTDLYQLALVELPWYGKFLPLHSYQPTVYLSLRCGFQVSYWHSLACWPRFWPMNVCVTVCVPMA